MSDINQNEDKALYFHRPPILRIYPNDNTDSEEHIDVNDSAEVEEDIIEPIHEPSGQLSVPIPLLGQRSFYV